MPWPAEERNGFSIKQWIGIGASGFMGFVGLVFVVVSLVQGGQGLCCGPMVFCATGLLLWLTIFNGWMIHGRWVPVDGAGGWVELLKGGIFKREDGMVGTFTLLKNKRFIDIFVAGRLADSWKILSWGMNSLEVQDMSGNARSFKRGKTLEQKQASPFHSETHRRLTRIVGAHRRVREVGPVHQGRGYRVLRWRSGKVHGHGRGTERDHPSHDG